MSKPLVERKTRNTIGCNIKPGQPPGGMSSPLRQGSRVNNHGDAIRQEYRQVVAAANVVLEKRGWRHQPDPWRDSISQHVAEARAQKENTP